MPGLETPRYRCWSLFKLLL